ncbi:MAG: formylglycine-generating enzyme family protein, partial [Deltaproteobacteria bacterium]|nr:formylglycine-generating enzyme family protein [Deltaproteobacteria bacterium]
MGECGQDGCGGYCPPCHTGDPKAPWSCDQHWTLCDETTRTCVPMERICGPCSDASSLCDRQKLDCEAAEAAVPLADCSGGWCRVQGGVSFVMGGPDGGEGKEWGGPGVNYENSYPRHPVVLTRGFEIMQTEVTTKAWLEVMGTATAPTRYPACGSDCPVSMGTFFDVLAFANRASQKSGYKPCYVLEGCNSPAEGWKLECERAIFVGPDCGGYRLPSEAEFELAAGAGVTSCFPNGCALWGLANCAPEEDVSKMAWFCGNSAVGYEGCKDCSSIGGTGPRGPPCCGPHPVGQKEPNAFGLLDVIGNVVEFTGTLKADHHEGLAVDPGFDTVINQPVIWKGGSYSSTDTNACVGRRNGIRLDFEGVDAGGVGFRP